MGEIDCFPMDYFVDLMTAALIPSHLEFMTGELVEHMRQSGRVDRVTTVACPKRGNPLLLAAVARELQLEPVFVKERPLFGKSTEGIGGRPKRAALVDDISSDGDLLVKCAKVLREGGYEVTDTFVLIDRPEQGLGIVRACLVGDARGGWAGLNVGQARFPAIMWVSKPMTRPEDRGG